MPIALHIGDCRAVLATLPDASVHCVVTSPPYWGLRDYGTAIWQGGDPGCEHVKGTAASKHSTLKNDGRENFGSSNYEHSIIVPFREQCGHCGAIRIDAQLGLEPDFNAYVANMVAVFREVRRVLRDDGTLWLNLGDCYAGGGRGAGNGHDKQSTNKGSLLDGLPLASFGGVKAKDLVGMPWTVAFALRADGWYLRQDIIWSKPNPMPESVTDRCTKAHEYLFLLSKRPTYYYDADAIAEPVTLSTIERVSQPTLAQQNGSYRVPGKTNGPMKAVDHGATRNKRSVWEVTTQPFSEAHFATFPPALIEPCIKAGTSEKGCCGKCGKPWVRQVKRMAMVIDRSDRTHDLGHTRSSGTMLEPPTTTTLGWSPSCACAADPVPCTVLDPFGGAGTTGLVADRLQRNAILIELNPAYAAMSSTRIKDDAPLFAEVTQP